MKESLLYLCASLICFLAFLISGFHVINKRPSHQKTIIILIGLLSFSKSIEYYEKYVYKLNTNH